MMNKKKKPQKPMMKRINKPFGEVMQRLMNVDPEELSKDKKIGKAK